MSRTVLVTLPRALCRVLQPTSLRTSRVRSVATGAKLKNITNLRRWGKVCVSNCLGYDAPELAATNLKMTSSDIACAVKYITHGTYERLGCQVLGWCGDPWGGYTQVRAWQRLHNEQFISNMSPLHADPSMLRLLNLVEENINGLSAKEAVETLFSLLLIGYHTSPVTYQLLAYTKGSVGAMDIKCLMLLARISDLFPRDDFPLIRMVLRRYQDLLVEGRIPRNDETVNAFCVFTKMLYRYMSGSLHEKFYDYLLRVVTQDMPLHLYSIDTLVNVSLVSLNGTASTQKQIINAIKKQLPGRISEFKPYHLMKLSTAMQSQSLYDDSTRKILDSQIWNMIGRNRDNFGLREIMMMFRSLTSKSDRNLIQRVETLVEKRLKKNDLDDRLTVQLARSLYKVDSSNVDLVERVQAKVAEYPVSLNLQISSFVTLKEFINTEHKEALVEKLLQCIEGDEMYINGEHLRNRCTYVLALMVPLSEKCNDKLLQMIPTWKFEELSLFLYGLTKWPYQEYLVDRRRKNQEKPIHQISGVFEAVMENLVEKVDTSKTQAFFMAVLAAANMKWTEKLYYMQVLMGRFHADATSIIANSTRRSLCDILKFCTTSRYFDAQLCDALSEAVVWSQDSELQHSTFHYLLAYLGICGYTPQNAEDLMPGSRWLLAELYKANNLHQYLRTMSNLVTLGSVPVDQLASVFTTDFLAKLNLFLKDNPDQQISAYEHLVFLNQAAVLDYPELSVPWFLGDIVEKIGKVPSQTLYIWENVLRQVLGGSQYYQKFTRSPVGHHIDFELVTDHTNTVQEHGHASSNSQRRVAILVEPERFYCMVPKDEARRKLGKRQKLSDHLHKLGYFVLDLPGHEWPHRKADYEGYLRKKLLQANVKLRTSVTSHKEYGVKASNFR